MRWFKSSTPPGRATHGMGYDGAGRMNTFTSPPNAQSAPLSLEWRYDRRGRLDQRVSKWDFVS